MNLQDLTPNNLFDNLSSKMPGYEVRQAQLDAAQLVYDCLNAKETGVLEAGTGTGKSLVGLVPSILAAKQMSADRAEDAEPIRIVVSTATIALQEQYVTQDLPMLRENLGIPFSFAMVKGRGNYLSKRRLQRATGKGAQLTLDGLPATAAAKETQIPMYIEEWAKATTQGDKAELDEIDPEVWAEIKSDSNDCLAKKCPTFSSCHYYAQRRKNSDCDVLVVNHALLLTDYISGGQILPEYDFLIIDEAHQLEEYARTAFTSEITQKGLTKLAGRIKKEIVPLKVAPQFQPEHSHKMDELSTSIGRFLLDLPWVFSAMTETLDLSKPEDRKILDFDLPNLERLKDHLSGLRKQIVNLASFVMVNDESKNNVKKCISQIEEYLDSFENILEGDGNRIRWVHFEQFKNRTGYHVYLRSTPVDLSGYFKSWLFEEESPVSIWMSATLAIDGKFDFFMEGIGLDADQPHRSMVVGSPFDYKKQSLLYVPKNAPDSNADEYRQWIAEEIIDLLHLSKGRAFVLFTSFKAMKRAHEDVWTKVPFLCKAQGEGSKRKLLEWFNETPNAVLFAVASFWEGVSIPGDALSLVIIDKLPFQSPGDPVYEARCDLLKTPDDKWAWFNKLALPYAILRLKQGFGRLIRKTTDSGIVAILDNRLTTKGYGAKVIRSLPPAYLSHKFDQHLFSQFLQPIGGHLPAEPVIEPSKPDPHCYNDPLGILEIDLNSDPRLEKMVMDMPPGEILATPVAAPPKPPVTTKPPIKIAAPGGGNSDRPRPANGLVKALFTGHEITSFHKAIKLLAGACDGAEQIDGQGFNKADSAFGKQLAQREVLSQKQAEIALRLAIKYRRQLPTELQQICGAAMFKVSPAPAQSLVAGNE